MQYERRFKHPVPPSVIRGLSFGTVDGESFSKQLNGALESGVPVKEWSEWKPDPNTVDDLLVAQKPESTQQAVPWKERARQYGELAVKNLHFHSKPKK
jgi:hypothetical protein